MWNEKIINQKLNKLAENVKHQYFILIVSFLLFFSFLIWGIIDILNNYYIYAIIRFVIAFLNGFNIYKGFNLLGTYKEHKRFLVGVKNGEITEENVDNFFKNKIR